jgi:hypothetical protein
MPARGREGRFAGCRDVQRDLYHRRPDGPVILRFSHRLVDMREPRACVREPRAVYRARGLGTAVALIPA